jgi:hypothetical protein
MKRRPRRASPILLAAVVALSAASAAAIEIDDFTTALPGGSGKTWAQVLQQVFPDFAPSPAPGKGATSGGVYDWPSIGVANKSWVQCGDRLTITGMDVQRLRIAGRDRLLASFSFADDCAALLALFAADGELLEIVNVKADRNTFFPKDYLRPLGAGGWLVIVGNAHHNSNQGFLDLLLVLARADRLTALGDVGTLSERDCREHSQQNAVIRVLPGRGPLARIEAEVTTTTRRLAKDCETPLGKSAIRNLRTSWRWNSGKRAYVADRR